MSHTVVSYPRVAMLAKAEEYLRSVGQPWRPKNDRQRAFLVDVYARLREEVPRIPEIESVASREIAKVNAFLKRRGFSITLDEVTGDAFGVASVLDVLVEWTKRGRVQELEVRRKRYPAVRIIGEGVQFCRGPNHKHPIAYLTTKSGDRVYLTVLDRAFPGDGLLEQGAMLMTRLQPVHEFDGVVFPMVSLDVCEDIGWLSGLETVGGDGRPAWIGQALQQTKFRMNEVGARAESAAAATLFKSMVVERKPDLVINEPFLIWIARDGLTAPLFAGYITQEDWKQPASLS